MTILNYIVYQQIISHLLSFLLYLLFLPLLLYYLKLCVNLETKTRVVINWKTKHQGLRQLAACLHAFLTSALDRNDVISWSKYLRNLKQYIIESVRQWLMDWLWVRQWSEFISGFTSHTISCHPATPSVQTVIQSFITPISLKIFVDVT